MWASATVGSNDMLCDNVDVAPSATLSPALAGI